jgi:hypothetical protein
VLSLFGGVYAFRANRNAIRASDAANRAVSKNALLDVVTEFGVISSRIEDIRGKLVAEDFNRSSDLAREIAVAIAKITISENVALDKDAKSDLGETKLRVQKLIEIFEQRIHQDKAFDPIKVGALLQQSEETIAVLQVRMKEKVHKDE